MDFRIHSTTPERDAEELLRSGEWKTNVDVGKEIFQRCTELRDGWKTWSSLGMSIVVRNYTGPDRSLDQLFQAFNEIEHEYLARNSEMRILPRPRYDDGLMALRVHPFAIYRVGKTFQSGALDALSLPLALGTVSPYPFLMAAWAGLTLLQLYRKIVGGYERLTDPAERAVFEAVHKKASELAVVNYDGLRDQAFENVYGSISPSTDDVCLELKGHFNPTDVLRALGDLKAREILTKNAERWFIVW